MSLLEHLGEYLVIGGFSVIVYAMIQNRIFPKRRSPYSRHFEDRARVYEVMNEVLQGTSAKRFLILKTTNGGGKPRIGAHLYASVLYEDFISPFHSVKAEYQRVVVDSVYINMLSDISRRGTMFFDTSGMEEGILKRIYDSEGVAASMVAYLNETSDAFYYCSIATDHSGIKGFVSEVEQLRIELSLNRLRDTFRRAQK